MLTERVTDHILVRAPHNPHPMSSPLKQLVEIISSGVKTLESAYDKDGVPLPSLNDPFVPTAMDTNMEVNATAQLIVAAAFQIIATVRAPMETLQDYAPAMYTSGALAVVVDANVADILKTAGPQVLAPLQQLFLSLLKSPEGNACKGYCRQGRDRVYVFGSVSFGTIV